jgi:hypothetical protein
METIYITIDEIEHAMRVAKNTNSGIQLDKLQTLVLIDHLNNVEESLKCAERAESELAKVLEQNRWIPVSERLPENGKMLLAYDSIGDEIKKGYHMKAERQWGNQWTLDGTYYHTHNYDRITHYVYLPSAPKEEE